jgi:hypothetical protein
MKTYRSRNLKRNRSRAERDLEINAQVCSILNSCNIRLLKIRTNIKIKIEIKIKIGRQKETRMMMISVLILTMILLILILIDNQADISSNSNNSISNSSNNNSNSNSNNRNNRHLNNIIEIGRLLFQLWINHMRINIRVCMSNKGKSHNSSNNRMRMSRKILLSMILNSRN